MSVLLRLCMYKGMHVWKIQETAKRQDISVMMRCIDTFYRLLLGFHRSQLPVKSHIYEWKIQWRDEASMLHNDSCTYICVHECRYVCMYASRLCVAVCRCYVSPCEILYGMMYVRTHACATYHPSSRSILFNSFVMYCYVVQSLTPPFIKVNSFVMYCYVVQSLTPPFIKVKSHNSICP